MKTSRVLVIMSMVLAGMFTACEQNVEMPNNEQSILPERFGISIPNALSNGSATNGRKMDVESLNGNVVYWHLNTFIEVGEEAGHIVGDIIYGIRRYGINKPMYISFESDEDGRTKNIVVEENVSYDGKDWEFQLTVTDADSEGNDDGGKGLQIFWNRSPIKGIAIIKPSNINKNEEGEWKDVLFRVDYSEAGEYNYDAHMVVSIDELPLADPLENPYSISTLKMFVGKKGSTVDVYGNSDHPNATFFAGNSGFNWAFVASGNDALDIGVAEVGLPPSGLNESGREQLLDYYSIKNVFTREINEVWPYISPESVEAFLFNTDAPGFFNKHGFIQGGESPGPEFDGLATRLNDLTPYNPRDMETLDIQFK